MKSILAFLLALVVVPAGHGAASDEAAFLADAARKLNGFATAAAKSGFPKRAREVWLELVSEYAPDDEIARKSLGFLRVGTSWAPDPNFEQLDQDKLDAAAAANLMRRWTSLCDELGKGHLALAEKLDAAGATERANYHRERAGRFLPNDSKVGAARGMASFEGISGTPLELEILKRSKRMSREVQAQLANDYPTKPVAPDAALESVTRTGIALQGVASEHFMVFGDHPIEVLTDAAKNAERSLAFCEVAFDGAPDVPRLAGCYRRFVFLSTKDAYDQVLRANEARIEKSRLEFMLQHTTSTTMGNVKDGYHLAGVVDVASVQDLAARYVAQRYSGVRTDAMVEGVGHAVVGMLFGRNLVFTVGQERAKRTVAGQKKSRLLVPDIESWVEEAAENAWQKTGTPAVQLPLVSAAEFPDDGRIKAWSFVDYLLRRDPSLILKLDRTAPEAKNHQQIAAKFAETTGGIAIDQLDDGWRRFWTEDTPLIRAVRGKPTPLEAVSKSATGWLAEFNAVRKQFQRAEVGWSERFSADCKSHVEYLKANATERGPVAEHLQKGDKKGATANGRTFAPRALVSTAGSDARKVVASWLDLPGYRDAILNPNIDTVGCYADGGIVVFDANRGTTASTTNTLSHYPLGNQQNVPTEVAVKDLGPDVEALLRSRGKANLKTLGYPLTVHFYRGTPRNPAEVTCELRHGKDVVEGLLHVAGAGTSRRASAQGMFVFYPLQPLKRGQTYELAWTIPGGRNINVKFQTK
jgi:hypothetical protein